jgi:endonuclease YncB( thermonuclease family)|tara:strand:+ start:630 stop:1079 length:450 start_codon:yes stop_codon:yes gene_type:complete
MAHDFKNFPELTNRQMQVYYFESPHKQVTEDFRGRVIKVTDGDTIRVEWEERELPVTIRMAKLAAPESKEKGGLESKTWLSEQIMGKEVDVKLSKKRVEKWGRILATIYSKGMNIGDESIRMGHAVSWDNRNAGGSIPNFFAELDSIKL